MAGTALPLWLPITFLWRTPSVPASEDRNVSLLPLELGAVDVVPDSLLVFGDIALLELELPAELLLELKSLWRLFFGVNTKCTV